MALFPFVTGEVVLRGGLTIQRQGQNTLAPEALHYNDNDNEEGEDLNEATEEALMAS